MCGLSIASVIKRKVFSHFPNCGDEMQRVLRNQVIFPTAEFLSEVPLHVLFCKLGGQRLHEKKFFQADHFVPLIQFYNHSRKRKRALQHFQTQTKKSKIDIKSMFNNNFIQKSSVSFKQPIGKNMASFFTKMPLQYL